MINMKKISLFIAFVTLLIPISYSDGGCIKVADDVLVQLSSAPVVPIAGKQVSYLFSFGNKQGLINREINGTVKIEQTYETIFNKSFKIEDGIFELKHIYENPGMYEIFFDFQIENRNYKPEDFLVEVIDTKNDLMIKSAYFITGIIIGVILTKFITKKNMSKK